MNQGIVSVGLHMRTCELPRVFLRKSGSWSLPAAYIGLTMPPVADAEKIIESNWVKDHLQSVLVSDLLDDRLQVPGMPKPVIDDQRKVVLPDKPQLHVATWDPDVGAADSKAVLQIPYVVVQNGMTIRCMDRNFRRPCRSVRCCQPFKATGLTRWTWGLAKANAKM